MMSKLGKLPDWEAACKNESMSKARKLRIAEDVIDSLQRQVAEYEKAITQLEIDIQNIWNESGRVGHQQNQTDAKLQKIITRIKELK